MTSDPYEVHLTRAQVLRHTPSKTQGFEAALVDIAQDLLLRHLSDIGLLDHLVFKGGTALRKLYAGAQGRFSLDLDFSVRDIGEDPDTIVDMLAERVSGLRIDGFIYGIEIRRGKRILTIDTDLGPTGQLASKLDVNPPPWLEPITRQWIPMDIHAVYAVYGGPLPALSAIQIEENIAEKVARLNRTTTARDVYDLVWLWRHYRDDDGQPFNAPLVRRLIVLKIWVDAHGIEAPGTRWKPGHQAVSFDPDHWLRERPAADFDHEDIGQLSVPPPDLRTLAADMRVAFAFLRDLDRNEAAVAATSAADRGLVLNLLAELPGRRLPVGSCW